MSLVRPKLSGVSDTLCREFEKAFKITGPDMLKSVEPRHLLGDYCKLEAEVGLLGAFEHPPHPENTSRQMAKSTGLNTTEKNRWYLPLN